MALRSLDIASDGLLAGGFSLHIAVRGLLRVFGLVGAIQSSPMLMRTVGKLIN